MTKASLDTCLPSARSEDWWAPKLEEMRAYLERGRREVLLVGDSLAARWPKHVLWPSSQSPVHRFAIGGDRTQHILWRLERLDFAKVQPSTIVLFAGANNITAGPTEGAVAMGVLEVIKLLREKAPTAELVVMGIPLRGADFGYRREFITATNKIISDSALARGFHHIDTNPAFIRASGGVNPSFLFDDEVHYSESGYVFMAGAIDAMGFGHQSSGLL